MGVYINPKYLAGFSDPHKAEISKAFGIDVVSKKNSTPLKVLNILLHGKAELLPNEFLPKRVTLEEVKEFFPNIPLEIAQEQFSKADFLLHKFYLLSNGMYWKSMENLLRELAEREIVPNLHILHQILFRCDSLVECCLILENEQFSHLKGTYNKYIIGTVYKKCKNPTQRQWAERYFSQWGKNTKKRNIPKQAPDFLTPVTSETPPKQQILIAVAPVPISLSDQDAIAFGRKRGQFVQKDTAYTGRSRDMPKPRKLGTDIRKTKIKTKGGVPPKKPTKKK